MPAIIDETFPAMCPKWTGSSSIHRSVWVSFITDEATREFIESAPVGAIMRVLRKGNFHEYVANLLMSWPLGDDVEWLLSLEDFHELVYFLLKVNMQGDQPNLEGKNLKNPITGNVFIPLFIKGKVIGAIRFWLERSMGYVNLGLRVRFEPIISDQHEGSERERTRKIMVEVHQAVNAVENLDTSASFEAAEPISDEEKGLRVRVGVPGDSFSEDMGDDPEDEEDENFFS